jgi:upstream activation factor subunit UAF30
MSQQMKTKTKSTTPASTPAPTVAPVAVELSAPTPTPVVKKEKKEKKVEAAPTASAAAAAAAPDATVSAPVLTATATPTPVIKKEKKEKKVEASASASASASVSESVSSASAPESVSSASASSAVAEESASAQVGDLEASIAAQSAEFMTKLNQLGSMVAALKTEYRSLEKKWSRELKTAQKTCSKKKKRAGNRAPSGFVKPTRISDELASFLGKDKGTEMARTDVTREINLYIRSNNLQDTANGRKINPDTKLQSLLKLKTTDELTYFNLQKYMSPHFQKAADAAAAAALLST